MNIKTLPVGQMKANCYLIWDESHQCTIIDPGDDADYISNILRDNDLRPIALLATHGHLDHIMAGLELQLAYNIPFYIHGSDMFLLNNMQSSAKKFLGLDAGPPPKPTHFLENDMKIMVEDSYINVITTPGHTPGSVCFYSKSEGSIFVGDLMFADGQVGRTDFSYSDKVELKNSLRTILELPGETKVYPGHGESMTIRQLKEIFE